MEEQNHATPAPDVSCELNYSRPRRPTSEWRCFMRSAIAGGACYFFLFFANIILFNPHIGLFSLPDRSIIVRAFGLVFSLFYFPIVMLSERQFINSWGSLILVLGLSSFLAGLLAGCVAAGFRQWRQNGAGSWLERRGSER